MGVKAVLAQHEKQKKKKCLAPWHAQGRHFTPFVASVDGLLGREANAVLQNLLARFAEKSGKSYSAALQSSEPRTSSSRLPHSDEPQQRLLDLLVPGTGSE